MAQIIALLCLFVATALAQPAGNLPWCFVRQDCNEANPNSDWNKGVCKDGKMQSPIDIPDASSLKPLPGDSQFSINADDYAATFFKVNNDGKHTELGSFKTKSGNKPTLQYGDRGSYILEEVHVHWGPDDKDGSEHHIGGKPFAGEIHFTHYKSDFKDFDEAKKSGTPGSVANLALVLSVAPADGAAVADAALKPLIDILPRIAQMDKWAPVEGNLDLHALIRTQTKAAAYDGSATTPPCAENVQWFVGLDPVTISSGVLQKFRTNILGVDGKPLNKNTRKVKPFNNRPIGVINIKH